MPLGLSVSEVDLIASICRESFFEFVKEFWPVVVQEKAVWNWHIHYLCALRQASAERVFKGLPKKNDYIVNVCPGSTKALDIETPILTTHGWKRHGDLRPGDFVYGVDGTPKRVLAITPHKEQECSVVSFKNPGKSITAANTHLWKVVNNQDRSIKQTKNLKKGTRPDAVEVPAPLDFPPQYQVTDPYVLGLWLGDGDSNSGCIYVCEEDKEMVAQYGRLGHTTVAVQEDNGITGQDFHRYVIPKLSQKLRAMGLLNNKHIPPNYLMGSVGQRVALLQGLMDTDGHCDKRGVCKFTNKNKRLISQVKFLLDSLGILCRISEYTVISPLSGKVCGPYYDVTYIPPANIPPFRLKRKLARVKPRHVRSERTYIKNIVPVGKKLVNCISVEEEMYLAGRGLVPTHNSTIFSIMFQPWVWTRMPSAKFISGSYTEPLSRTLSLKARDLVRSEKYQTCFPYVRLRSDQDTKTHFMNTAGGMRYAVGVGGSVIGMHGHFLDVDDPIDPEGAFSREELTIVNRWMSETLPSRKVDKKVSVMSLIMQRLAEDDPTGYMLANEKLSIKHVCLPAELSDDVKPDFLKKNYVNGLFDPVRLDRAALDESFARLGDYGYSCQFMQTPIPRGGGYFQTDRLVIDTPPNYKTEIVKIVRYWDKAATMGGGAFTVGLLMAVDKAGRFWVLDVIRVQLESSRREALIKQTAQTDGVHVKIKIEQEPGSGGKESAEATVRNLAGYKVQVERPHGNKELRADAFATQVNSGNVYLAKAQWNKDYINEMRFFPLGKYKDQIDASSGAFNDMVGPTIVCGGF
jgi:predicted phage terminase large subunit-like protein